METIRDLQKLERAENLMPVLFIGHGNPMNGIEENDFTRGWQKSIENTPEPKAIVVVSAHWKTRGVHITSNERPRTIYDFYGFPQELSEARYDAPGNPELAEEIARDLKQKLIELDESWGLDHGSWTVLRHLFPNAEVPVLQLSLNRSYTPRDHYELAKELAFLRERGVLIIGSGNMVHNLRLINFRAEQSFEWAEAANEQFKELILSGEHEKLINYETLGKDAALAIPTAEHYLPLLYAMALKNENEPVEIFNDAIDLGSISMTSVRIG